MEIQTVPAQILKEKCNLVDIEDIENYQNLANKMAEEMYRLEGVGLAAPQVGQAICLLVIDPAIDSEKRNPIFFVNPEVMSVDGEEEEADEGCLSIPGVCVKVKRKNEVTVRALDLNGEPFEVKATGFAARVLQHELDHLEGKTLFEHLDVIDRIEKFREYELAVTSGAKPGETSVEKN